MQGETYIIDLLLIKPFLYPKLFIKNNVYPSVKKEEEEKKRSNLSGIINFCRRWEEIHKRKETIINQSIFGLKNFSTPIYDKFLKWCARNNPDKKEEKQEEKKYEYLKRINKWKFLWKTHALLNICRSKETLGKIIFFSLENFVIFFDFEN